MSIQLSLIGQFKPLIGRTSATTGSTSCATSDELAPWRPCHGRRQGAVHRQTAPGACSASGSPITLRDLQHAGLDVVDQALFAGDAPGPESSQVPLQRLGFTQSGKRMALNVFDQCVDLVAHASIGARPVEIILPGTRCPDSSHRMSLCGRPRPAFKSRTALPSRAAVLGLESR